MNRFRDFLNRTYSPLPLGSKSKSKKDKENILAEFTGEEFTGEECLLSPKVKVSEVVYFAVGNPMHHKIFKLNLKICIESSPIWAQMISEAEFTSGYIRIPNVPPCLFAELLKIVKMGPMNQLRVVSGYSMVPELNSPMLMLRLSLKFHLQSLMAVARENILNNRRYFLYQGVALYEICKRVMNHNDDLSNRRLKYIEERLIRCFEQLLPIKHFEEFSQESLITLLGHEELFIHNELNLFNACVKWAKAKCHLLKIPPTSENMRDVLGKVIYLIRFPLLEADYLVSVARHQLLTPEESVSLKRYWELRKTDKNAAKAMDLPFIKQRRFGTLFTANIYPPSRKNYCQSGIWKQVRLKVNRPLEIDTLIFCGKIEALPYGYVPNVNIVLKFQEKSRHEKRYITVSSETFTGPLQQEDNIKIHPKKIFKMIPGHKYKLNFVFTDGTGAKLLTVPYRIPSWKKVVVPCGKRGNVEIEASKDSSNCFFRGFNFRVLSKTAYPAYFEKIF